MNEPDEYGSSTLIFTRRPCRYEPDTVAHAYLLREVAEWLEASVPRILYGIDFEEDYEEDPPDLRVCRVRLTVQKADV